MKWCKLKTIITIMLFTKHLFELCSRSVMSNDSAFSYFFLFLKFCCFLSKFYSPLAIGVTTIFCSSMNNSNYNNYKFITNNNNPIESPGLLSSKVTRKFLYVLYSLLSLICQSTYSTYWYQIRFSI